VLRHGQDLRSDLRVNERSVRVGVLVVHPSEEVLDNSKVAQVLTQTDVLCGPIHHAKKVHTDPVPRLSLALALRQKVNRVLRFPASLLVGAVVVANLTVAVVAAAVIGVVAAARARVLKQTLVTARTRSASLEGAAKPSSLREHSAVAGVDGVVVVADAAVVVVVVFLID